MKRAGIAPEWEDVEPWVVRFCERNAWKVEPLLGADDLYQEAAIKFLQLRAKYPEATQLRHFQSLMMNAFNRRLVTLAARRLKEPPRGIAQLSCHVNDNGRFQNRGCDRQRFPMMRAGATDGDGPEMYEVLEQEREAPPDQEVDLKMVLEDAPEEVRRIVSAARDGLGGRRKKRNGRRESDEELLERLYSGFEEPTREPLDGNASRTFLQWAERTLGWRHEPA